MNDFTKLINCLKECDVYFKTINVDEIIIPMPGFRVNNKVIDATSIFNITVSKDIEPAPFCGVHITNDKENGMSWCAVYGEDAE